MTVFLVAFILSALGAWVTGLNFYMSCLRYPLHQLLHRSKPDEWVSGFPLIGSLFLWVGAAWLWWLGQKQWAKAGLAVSLLDTGGLHWFCIVMAYQAWKDKT